MSFRTHKALVRTSLTHPATKYVEINAKEATDGTLFLRWFDTTSSATCTVEQTDLPSSPVEGSPADVAASDSTTATHWATSAVSITGPAGAAAGCEMVQLASVMGSKRLRLKIVTAADTDIEVWAHIKGVAS